MGIITGGRVSEGTLGPYTTEGAPVNGTDEVQRLTVTEDSLADSAGEEYKLSFEGFTTVAINSQAAASAVQTALRALNSIGATGCSVSGSPGGPYDVTFTNDRGKQDVPLIVDEQFSDLVSVAVTVVTPGVNASARGALKGATLRDITNGKEYINTGTPAAPTWTVVGSQS